MRVIRIAIAACGLLVFTACGDTATSGAVVSISQSAELLSEPPHTHHVGVIREWMWSADDESPDVRLIRSDGGGGAHQILAFDGIGIMSARTREVDNTVYLIVGVLNTDETMTVYRLHDSDDDGLPDSTTQTELFSTTGKAYITSISISGSDFYLLDRRCGDVLVAVDSGADNWPDEVNTDPFAMRDDYAELSTARSIEIRANGTLRVYAGIYTPRDEGVIPYDVYEDVDDDSVADSRVAVGVSHARPIPFGQLYDGQTSVTIDGTPGKTVEVWELDSDLNPQAMLGSAAIGTDYTGAVGINRTLVLGEQVAIHYTGEQGSLHRHPVHPDWPQIVETEPELLVAGTVEQEIAITGHNLEATMTVYLRAPDGVLRTLMPTIVNSTRATVTIPAVALGSAGSAHIYALDSSQTDPEDEGAFVARIRICAPIAPE